MKVLCVEQQGGVGLEEVDVVASASAQGVIKDRFGGFELLLVGKELGQLHVRIKLIRMGFDGFLEDADGLLIETDHWGRKSPWRCRRRSLSLLATALGRSAGPWQSAQRFRSQPMPECTV